MAEDIVIVVRDNLVRDVYSEDGRGFVVVDFDVEADEPYVCRMPGWTRENLPSDTVALLRERGLAGFRQQIFRSEIKSLDEEVSDLAEFRKETIAWIEAVEETVRGTRLKADAADAQAKAQASATLNFEERWTDRLEAMNLRIAALERHVSELARRLAALEGGGS